MNAHGTGGQALLWQSAYAELYFTETLWPDFSREKYAEALEWYAGRERRFGLTPGQAPAPPRKAG